MLWLTLGGLISLIAGGLTIKLSKATTFGVILAVVGALLASIMGVAVIKDQSKKGALCASISGTYGGDACYVDGVEKDLKELGL